MDDRAMLLPLVSIGGSGWIRIAGLAGVHGGASREGRRLRARAGLRCDTSRGSYLERCSDRRCASAIAMTVSISRCSGSGMWPAPIPESLTTVVRC
jgi:hypothetical protein